MPPPHELAAEAKLKEEAAQAKLTSSNSKKKSKVPLTTKEKIAAAAAARVREDKRKQGVVHDGVGLKVVGESDGKGGISKGKGGNGGKGKKVAAEKPRI